MTTQRTSMKAILAVFGMVIITGGCDNRVDSHAESGAGSVSNESSGTTLITRSATQLPEGVTGKPGAGISVDYKIPKSIQPGEVVAVEIHFSPSSIEGALHVDLVAEGIELISPETAFDFTLGTDEILTAEVSVYSGQAVRAYLNLFMTLENEAGFKSSQAVSIPVQVGSAIAAKSTEATVDANGQRLHILPAEETIISSDH